MDHGFGVISVKSLYKLYIIFFKDVEFSTFTSLIHFHLIFYMVQGID